MIKCHSSNIGVSSGMAGIMVVVSIVIVSCIRRKQSSSKAVMKERNMNNNQYAKAFVINQGSLALKQYSFSEIKKMTNSFKDKLGHGGYGSVYKGQLLDGRLVAVKVIISESKGSGEEFINEVASISRTSLVNIVTLLGYCYQATKRALVYEFISNGSLEKFIYNQGSPMKNCHLERK